MNIKRFSVLICFLIIILSAVSSVNAGIFEFAEDVDEADDDIDEAEEDELEREEFDIKISSSQSLASLIDELNEQLEDDYGDDDYWDDDYFDDYEIITWLENMEGDYIVFYDDDGDYVIFKESLADKIPDSDKYSSCTLEGEVVEFYEGSYSNFYLIKDFDVTDKFKKEKAEKTSDTSSHESEDSKTKSSSDSAKSVNTESQAPYIGNSATGKFHAYSCHDVCRINPSNIVKFYSRDEAVNSGYSPCGHCRP